MIGSAPVSDEPAPETVQLMSRSLDDVQEDIENPLRIHTTHASQQLGTILDEVKCYMLEKSRADDTLLNLDKRPSEPGLNLEFVRERELDAMLKEGAAAAELAALHAGFMGGSGAVAVALWVFFGVLVGVAAFMWYVRALTWRGTKYGCQPWTFPVVFTFYYSMLAWAFLGRAFHLCRSETVEALVVMGHAVTAASLTLIFIGLVFFAKEALHRCNSAQKKHSAWASGLDAANTVLMGVHMYKLGRMFAARQTKLASHQFQWLRYHLILYFALLAVINHLKFRGLGEPIQYAVVSSLIFCIELWFRRLKATTKLAVNKIVVHDAAAYDHVWKGQAGLPWIADLVAELGPCTQTKRTEKPVVAIVRRELCSAGVRVPSSKTGPNTPVEPTDVVVKPRQAVRELGVLFAQAARLNATFQEVCEAWAATQPKCAHVHQCHVKRRKRAIEKLFRSYDGDASRLTDLVRSAITCDTPDSMLRLLRVILTDPRVAVLSYKNRFAAEYDSRASLGYRNIALNLILVTDFTMRHRVDNHIIELQIGLKAFDDLKNDEGHRRYVEWRDKSAE